MFRCPSRLVIASFFIGFCGPAILTSSGNAQSRGSIPLHPCPIPDSEGEMLCGSYEVFENRDTMQGRVISLNIAVLPALRTDPLPDPVFWLHGGPGVAATEAATWFSTFWMRQDRDIVLIDQRGTGGSNPLPCPLATSRNNLQEYLAGHFANIELYAECRRELESRADLKLYTTPRFTDDLDEVRTAMGYKKINLYAGSYGTRAALIYMRRHGENVRSAVLEAVAPISFRNPLYHAESAQAAIDLLFEECHQDPRCSAALPNVDLEFQEVLERLDQQPARVTINHLDTQAPVTLTLARPAFAEAIRSLMYSRSGNRWTPFLIHTAHQGNYVPILEFFLEHSRDLEEHLSWGLLLSVTCSEDISRIDPAEIPALTANTYYRDDRVRQQMAVCEIWPADNISPSYGEPVRSDVPTLLWSATLDPVVPPKWGRDAARYLSNSLHLIVPDAHSLGGPCIDSVTRDFLARASVKGLDTSCINDIRLPPFEIPQ